MLEWQAPSAMPGILPGCWGFEIGSSRRHKYSNSLSHFISPKQCLLFKRIMSMCVQVKATCVQVTLEVREGTGSPGAGVSDGFVLPKRMVGSKFWFSGRVGSAHSHWTISSAPAVSPGDPETLFIWSIYCQLLRFERWINSKSEKSELMRCFPICFWNVLSNLITLKSPWTREINLIRSLCLHAEHGFLYLTNARADRVKWEPKWDFLCLEC